MFRVSSSFETKPSSRDLTMIPMVPARDFAVIVSKLPSASADQATR